MKFRDVVMTRRSVRKFSNEDVEEDDLRYVLEMARLSPSWKNSQCWSFIVVRESTLKDRVVRKLPMVNIWVKKAPILIVVCADPDKSGYHNEMGYFLVDTAIAIEHLVLAAADIGLGTCWIGLFDEDGLKDVLGIPEGLRVVALTPLGHPTTKTGLRERLSKVVMNGDKRKTLDEIVHWDLW